MFSRCFWTTKTNHLRHLSQKNRASVHRRSFANLPTTNAQRQTIYALSTPPGKGGVAIVRVSGPDALTVWKRMDESLIDDGLAVYFRAPYSYTTRPTIELHIHSGRALISALLSSLSSLPNLRPAEPGEFTRQAFQGGRLDLTQVEGLHDLIEADTEVQRVWALGSAGGETRAEYDSLRRQIIHCLAQVEALIDFGEGEDIEDGVYEQAKIEASHLLAQIKNHLSDNRRGELVRSGIKMTIFGPPNAGKSSLFNYLANREASIVTPIPGTTRDVLELTLDIGGLPVVVADTAGLRETLDIVEGSAFSEAGMHISLCVLPLPEVLAAHSPQGSEILIPSSVRDLINPSTYFLFNKLDLVSPAQTTLPKSAVLAQDTNSSSKDTIDLQNRGWLVSLTTGEGSHAFVQGLSKALKARFNITDPSSSGQNKVHAPIITRARHRQHLESACKFLEAFMDLPPEDVVFAAEELRYAAQAIGRVTGDIGVEDVLDALFKDFCIGK
ncbi:hypothetical protein M413DRAFT_26792 [Hebeloma cylindrosporum]|uniref:TrmE-type G domain-containing protein n=1 Tax=Hebeloma cylindrosporum TaxID=76867 RepID=A0A0C3CGR4_HEBCY|nr:hypothetical protein M413DRAFT_26792 [Hebeloma cylindrosporum h7]